MEEEKEARRAGYSLKSENPCLSRKADEQAVLPPQDVAAIDVERAARALQKADFLLLASGAGLSADSGLATFATLTAKMGAQLGEGITYDHAAGSDTMAKDPALFYAFWLASYRNYADAEPHEGYRILREWRELMDDRAEAKAASSGLGDVVQPTFVLTSNVDGWSITKKVAAQDAFAQIHGSIHQWQCGGVPSGRRFPTWSRDRCCDELFDPPNADGFDFSAMPLRYSKAPPSCPRCRDGWLRPHIYMFGDGSRFANNEEVTGGQRLLIWQESVLSALRADATLRLAIVEIGCGLRVPNIRKRCESLCAECPAGQCEFVRINPEVTETLFGAKPTAFIQDTALAALQRIRSHMRRESEQLEQRT